MSDQTYYTNEDNFGNYQYVSISQVIDSLQAEAEGDNDSLLKGVPRYLLVKYAIEGVRDMNNSGNGDVLNLQLEVGSNLQFICPPDFVDYVAAYVVGADGELYKLDFNDKINIAKSFLQDESFNIIFDDEGNAIEADGMNVYDEGFSRHEYCGKEFASTYGTQSNADTSKISQNGDFVVDKQRGIISFSSNVEGHHVVLRYLSDGLQQRNIDGEQITIHKHIKTALEDFVFWRAISRRKSVGQSTKAAAKNTYITAKHRASILLKDISAHRINKAMRSHFKPLKF